MVEVELSGDVDHVSWEELARVFELAPLGHREPASLEFVFRNSAVPCFAYHKGRLVGAGRALSDGLVQAAIFDVVVLPEYQSKGVGRRIMEYVIREAHAERIMLVSVHGKEDFYRKLGFRRLTTAMARYSDPTWFLDNGYVEEVFS